MLVSSGKLTNLVYFDVDANFLDGSIPTELGMSLCLFRVSVPLRSPCSR